MRAKIIIPGEGLRPSPGQGKNYHCVGGGWTNQNQIFFPHGQELFLDQVDTAVHPIPKCKGTLRRP